MHLDEHAIRSHGDRRAYERAIVAPRMEFTLIESTGIKCRFLEHVRDALDLGNVEVVQSRAEDYKPSERFDTVLARAVGPEGQVVGVEGDRELVRRGGENARRNGISNAEFHMADLMQPLPSGASWLKSRFSHVLLDPPRAGAREMLPTVARLAPKRVLYISCHPGSLARDIGLMVHEHGSRLRAAGVLDMFPHTTHVESLAVLEPAGRAAI